MMFLIRPLFLHYALSCFQCFSAAVVKTVSHTILCYQGAEVELNYDPTA